MATGTVRVDGLDDLVRAFGKISKDLRREVQRELSDAAKIVATEARAKISGLAPPGSPRTVGGVRPRVRGSTAFVEQRLGKTTGKRGDWGAIQMRRAFLPSLDEKQDEVVERLDRMLDRLAGKNGF